MKCMNSLAQYGRIENDYPKDNLAPHWYHQFRHTAGLWSHKWRLVTFLLVVDNFWVEYIGKQHADHLIESIRKDYPVDVDWTGGLYYGIKLEWNYDIHAKLCPQQPTGIPTPISKNTPTYITLMRTPTLWNKNKKGQRGQFIRDPTRREQKTNTKSSK